MPFVKRQRSYYKYGTEPNATIVGSFARIDEGIASGFSSANYLTLSEVFNPQSNAWEQVWSVTTGANTSTTYQRILAQTNVGTAAVSGYDLRVDSGKIVLYVEGTDFRGTTVLQDYTHYLIKAEYTGSAYILSYSTDNGASWVEDCNVASTVTGVPDMNVPQYVGIWKSTYNSSPSEQWLGTIDLSQSYININGERWWSGDSYTKVGSWIDDGVVSGFSTSNYLSLPVLFGPASNPWERVICFKTSDTVAATQALNYINFANDSLAGVHFHIGSGGQISAQISSNGSSWDIAESFVGTTVLSANTTYYAMIRFTGSEYQLLLSTTGEFNGEETLENSITSSTPIYQSNTIYDRLGFRSSSLPQVFTGSMDLTKCYGKINNKDWWHGTKAVESTSSDYDYYEDKHKLYQLAKTKRTYYKHAYDDYTLPTMTSTTAPEGTVTTNVSSWYQLFFGNSAVLSINNNKTKADLYAEYKFAYPLAAGTYTVSLTAYKQSNAPANPRYIDVTLENGEVLTVGEFKINTSSTVHSFTFTTEDRIVAIKYYGTYGTSTVQYVVEYVYNFCLTAEGKDTNVVSVNKVDVEGTSTDYDYYTDKLLSYAPIVRGKRSYYKQDLNQRDTGTYTFTLDKDYTAKMLFVGNGGGGCSSQKDSRWHYSSGGSGACFEGLVRLPADTYTLTRGTLGYGNNYNNTHYWSGGVQSTDSFLTNSAGEELIRVGAGGMGYTSVGGVGGAAGVLTLGTLDILETKKATDGVYTAGNTSAGSVSAYDGTYSGYGAGTGSQRGQGNVYGIAGIFDLVLETDISDYDWYEDVGTKIY